LGSHRHAGAGGRNVVSERAGSHPSAVHRDLGRRVALHAALADPHRLRIVDLLALSDRPPTEIAERLGIGSNLLAHHVGILERAGLVERLSSAGDGRRRYLRLVPQVLGPMWTGAEPLVASAILFVCTANSARSQIAAALWNRASHIPAESAGTHPAGNMHPLAVRAAGRVGLDLTGGRPRSIRRIRRRPDVVITVCDRAREELAPFSEAAVDLHWSIPDPVRDGRASAFDETVVALDARVSVLREGVRDGRRRRKATIAPKQIGDRGGSVRQSHL
jgi:protein-tyrosine-phosphatase